MPAYTYPGVYIEEDATPGLSISSSATAVPVFAHDGTSQPPKMSPLPLVSAGMGMTLSTSSLSVGKEAAGRSECWDMGTISGVV